MNRDSIVLWVLPNHEFQTVPVLRACLKGFLKENPGVEVEIVPQTLHSIWNRLFDLVKTPSDISAPDLVQIPGSWNAALAQLQALENLSDLDPSLSLDPWQSSARLYCRPGDGSGIYSIPWWTEILALYYRKDVFARLGLDPSMLDTFQGLKSACRKIQKEMGRQGHFYPLANSNPRESILISDLVPFLWSEGGHLLDSKGARSLFQRREGVRGISLYLEFLDQGYMPLLGKSGLVPPSLFEGYCAMQFSRRYPKSMKNLGVVAFPAGSAGRFTLYSTQHLALVKGAASKNGAYRLLRYMTEPSRQKPYARSVGAFPAVPFQWEEMLADSGMQEVYRRSTGFMQGLPVSPIMGTLARIFERAMEGLIFQILSGQFRREQLDRELAHAAAQVDHILGQYA